MIRKDTGLYMVIVAYLGVSIYQWPRDNRRVLGAHISTFTGMLCTIWPNRNLFILNTVACLLLDTVYILLEFDYVEQNRIDFALHVNTFIKNMIFLCVTSLLNE